MIEIQSISNLIHSLHERNNRLRSVFDYTNKKRRLEEINVLLEQPSVWSDRDYTQTLSKERSVLTIIIDDLDNILLKLDESGDFFELAKNIKDENAIKEVIKELYIIENDLTKLEFNNMFSGNNDQCDCYIDFQSGSGGTEAQDWTSMLMRMYLRWLECKGFKSQIINESPGDIVGVKSATIHVSGHYAFGWLRTETGIHRLVRKSPFDAGHRRHTSFSSVFIYPELDHYINIDISLSDLRIDVYRASGAGGQHVNRTESAVRITHIPTGTVTQCQNNRSQHQNKEQAIKQMKAKLYEIEIKKKNNEKKILEENKSCISWGNQIRSYILDDSRIRDLRTGIEIRNVQEVLNGNLDPFIKESLKLGL
ncbi:peptide chain release factor 2 [Candidatus Pantoea edessiphila]|uniref:Peptide chain release factor 2 n=1 Tax=Candidatus Pantoea edessiphila TaxID=2044610 RepID=A0A2P5SXP6_9GAMM|nr:peptide chain release factor 2 [Candidatus Pantoea edessiphila]MBK4775697.1 peptide chain release factor 2 [Pantoea sp. Edef]PPI87072.1 peptide chain release factor 2 [Candidatus Pantoea edessiphila]